MTKPKANLLCAKWVYPHLNWEERRGGSVVSVNKDGKKAFFSLKNPRQLQAVTIKLERDHGWKITQDNHGVWWAKKHGQKIDMPVLENLLVLLVEEVEGK